MSQDPLIPEGGVPAPPGAIARCGLSVAGAVEAALDAAARAAAAEGRSGLIRALAGGVRCLLGADEVLIARYDRRSEGFQVLRLAAGAEGEPREEWIPEGREHPIAWAGESGRILWRNDPATDLRFPSRAGVGGSEILVPVRAGGERCIVLGCSTRRTWAFRAEDVEVFRRFGRMAGAVLLGARRLRRVRRHAFRDALTGVLNRGSFQHLLEMEVERSVRFGHPTVLLLIDIDDFKQINDEFGHPAGDRVLAGIAGILRSQFRRSDVVARYGGEEFAVILPMTALAGGRAAGEKLIGAVRAARWEGKDSGDPVRVTVSVGLAEFPGFARSAADLVRAADRGLYRAKGAGKDRVGGPNPGP